MHQNLPTPSLNAHGKFFVSGGKKVFFKATRLEIDGDSLDFHQKVRLKARLQELKEAHTTALVVGGTHAEAALDLAAQVGLSAMLEIGVAPAELLDGRGYRAISAKLETTARLFGGHPALAGYLLDLRVNTDLLRMHGLGRVQRRLRSLIAKLKRNDGLAMVAVKHRPPTRALALQDEDFIYSSVPAVTPAELKSYLLSLHDLAEARPVVIELEESIPEQDELVGCAFALGVAGVVASPIRLIRPDLLQVRSLAAAEVLPFVALNGTCPPALGVAPKVSVVICAYNAERTMRACLESLRALDYPDYEVVIVDDGSRDRTAEIAMEFPEFRLIRQPNKGLSVARNVGLQAACGEFVAYTDSDCVVDPHWLTLIVGAMVESGFDGCGGPNYAPPEEGRVEACVAVSPGAPCHVLLADDRAEHLAGCNMVFRKAALLKLGGFDPQFTCAGDDVDICWRALEAGLSLGFCPGAFVWHFRRNTVRAYYRQQRGYGCAEAMLYFKYPQRFNALGQISWQGRIPGLARTLPGGAKKKILWASRPFFQTVYEPEQGLLKFLPQTLEWNLVGLVALGGLLATGRPMLPACAMLALGPIWALYYGWQAPIEKRHARLSSRLLVAMLSYTGPLARALARYRLRLKGAWSAREGVEPAPRQRPAIEWLNRAVRLAYWNENYTTRDSLLERLTRLFTRAGHRVVVDSGWNDYDLEVRPDAWTRVEIKTADEEHEAGRLKNHVLARVRLTKLTKLPLLAGASAAMLSAACGFSGLGVVLGELTLVGAAFALSEAFESGRLAYRAVEECAAELDLIPLGRSTTALRRAAALAPAPTGGRKSVAATGLVAGTPPAE